MKKYLLLLAGALAAPAVQAQIAPEGQSRPPFNLPARVQQGLALAAGTRGPAPLAVAQRPGSVVRKPARMVSYAWEPSTGQWTMPLTLACTYDSRARLIQNVVGDSTTGVPSNRYSTTYDAAGHPTVNLTEEWVGAAWQNQERTLLTFNPRGVLTELLFQTWQNGAWQSMVRYTLTYDAHDHRTSSLTQNWVNNAWDTINASRNTLTHNAAGAVLEDVSEDWNPNTRAFELYDRQQFTYLPAAPLQYAQRLTQRWFGTAYVNVQRISNVVRDARQREVSMEDEGWSNGAWQLQRRYSTVYQATNRSVQQLTEQRVQNAWVNSSRYTDSFDDAGYYLGNLSESWTSNAWTTTSGQQYLLYFNAAHDLAREVQRVYSAASRTYVNYSKVVYSDYQPFVLAARPAATLAAATQLYPNPTAGRVTLALSGLRDQAALTAEVLTPLGQVVQTLRVQPRQGQVSQELDLSPLPAGVYFVRMPTADGVVTKRVVRQ